MCGRYVQPKSVGDLARIFGAVVQAPADLWEPSWNIPPSSSIPILLESVAGEAEFQRRIALAQWSLTPPWSKTLTSRFATFNARIESASEKQPSRLP